MNASPAERDMANTAVAVIVKVTVMGAVAAKTPDIMKIVPDTVPPVTSKNMEDTEITMERTTMADEEKIMESRIETVPYVCSCPLYAGNIN
jgi:hypothetical protein